VSAIETPFSAERFQKATGFLRRVEDRQQILIPSEQFQREFANYLSLAKDLRSQNLSVTESGKQPKLTIKVPKQICASGRVYCIWLPDTNLPRTSRSPAKQVEAS
jgi:hypothetical protein